VTFDIVKNMGASVRQRLLNYAKASGSPFAEVLQYYAMERFSIVFQCLRTSRPLR
jgi:hypothetical protein